MVTTRSTTNVVGPSHSRSVSVIAATTVPSNNRQKSPPEATVIMAGGIPVSVSVLGAPVVASATGLSVLVGCAPPVVPRPQPPLAALPGHLTRQDLVDFICRQDFMLNDYAIWMQRLEA
ncbi:hypothetical protein SESBI_36307 [Sesbania bispinosa]|nr:hypothetical protein SESBI_36307 [Sesbania bispinosa]